MLAIADEALAAGDIATAAQAYGHVLQDEPGHPKAVAGLARCYLKSGDIERARTTLQTGAPDGAQDEAIRAVEAELKLRDNAGAARRDRSAARQAGGRRQATIRRAMTWRWRWMRAATATARSPNLLELVRRDRKWNEDAARKQLVTLFEAMGPADPRTIEARRKLSGLLFS